jgi:hypothetical protein
MYGLTIYYLRHGYPTQTYLFSSLLLKLKKELGDGWSVRVTLARTTDQTNTFLLHISGWGHGLVKALAQHLASIKNTHTIVHGGTVILLDIIKIYPIPITTEALLSSDNVKIKSLPITTMS